MNKLIRVRVTADTKQFKVMTQDYEIIKETAKQLRVKREDAVRERRLYKNQLMSDTARTFTKTNAHYRIGWARPGDEDTLIDKFRQDILQTIKQQAEDVAAVLQHIEKSIDDETN